MPRGPTREDRPADMISCAVVVARIATGEEYEGPAAPISQANRRAAFKRAEALSPERRSEIARIAGAASRERRLRRTDVN